MIPPSTISDDAQQFIQEKLAELALQENIRILFAIESGSRAWGFPSKNSDYDVRFVYIRNRDDYLSIRPIRDVIETPLLEDETLGVPLDMNGWDIKKALLLATKSNATLNEWLNSPIKYIEDRSAASLISNFVVSCADLEAMSYHYNSIGKHSWKQIMEDNGQTKLKRYFYAIRPALAQEWIRQFNKPPPMDVYSLCKKLPLSRSFIDHFEKLILTKAGSQETDIIEKNRELDEFLSSCYEQKIQKSSTIDKMNSAISEADILFRKLLDNNE